MKNLLSGWKIETKEQALKRLKQTGLLFYVLAVLVFSFSLLIAETQGEATTRLIGTAFYNAAILLTLGCCIRNFQSRAASIAATVIFGFDAFSELIAGQAPTISLVVFCFSSQAVRASFIYRPIAGFRLHIKNAILMNVLAFVYYQCLAYASGAVLSFVLVLAGFHLDDLTLVIEQLAKGIEFILAVVVVSLTYHGRLPFAGNKPFMVPVDDVATSSSSTSK